MMRHAIVVSGVVTNVVELEAGAETSDLGEAIPSEVASIGDTYSNGMFSSVDSQPPTVSVKKQIVQLEATITPRRVREALLSGDTTFIRDVDAKISELRTQI